MKTLEDRKEILFSAMAGSRFYPLAETGPIGRPVALHGRKPGRFRQVARRENLRRSESFPDGKRAGKSPLCVMAKTQNAQKNTKKAPAKTPKEKKDAKREKKAAAGK